MPAASYRRPLKVPVEARSMLSFGGFGVAQFIDAFASPVQRAKTPARLTRRVYCRSDFSAPPFCPTFGPKLEINVAQLTAGDSWPPAVVPDRGTMFAAELSESSRPAAPMP